MHWHTVLYAYLSLGSVASLLGALFLGSTFWEGSFRLREAIAIFIIQITVAIFWPIFVPALMEEYRGWKKARWYARHNKTHAKASND